MDSSPNTSVADLTKIQENIVEALEAAATACQLLSSDEGAEDSQAHATVSSSAAKFVKLIQESQMKLLDVAKRYTPPVASHSQPYVSMAEALVACDQLQVAHAAVQSVRQQLQLQLQMESRDGHAGDVAVMGDVADQQMHGDVDEVGEKVVDMELVDATIGDST